MYFLIKIDSHLISCKASWALSPKPIECFTKIIINRVKLFRKNHFSSKQISKKEKMITIKWGLRKMEK